MATATQTSKILSAEQEAKLRQPIDEYVGKIQAQIDELRTDGTEKAVNIQNELDNLKRDRIYTAQEKTERETKLKAELAAAKAVEEKNKGQINKLIADAEAYLKAHYDSDYYQAVVASCKQEKVQAQQKYQAAVEQLKKEHETALSKLSNQQEIKDEKYVHKNRLFDAKMQLDKDCQAIKDRRHAAFDYKYHLIDMLRLSKFTVGESLAQKWENYKYTFNRRDFLLRNGLYIAIVIIFIILCLIAQFGKKVPLLTVNNILNILQQASPRMFLALGVAGLMGAGRTEIMRALFGIDNCRQGEVYLHGQKINIKKPEDAIKAGIGFITENRKTEGLILDFSILKNIALPSVDTFASKSVINDKKEFNFSNELSHKLGVKANSIQLPAGALSGGNQQKVVIAKWIGMHPSIIIMDEPTRGIDVGAKRDIYDLMNELTAQGVAIIMVSSDLPEVIGMSDRILVVHEGKIAGEIPHDQATQENIITLATGGI